MTYISNHKNTQFQVEEQEVKEQEENFLDETLDKVMVYVDGEFIWKYVSLIKEDLKFFDYVDSKVKGLKNKIDIFIENNPKKVKAIINGAFSLIILKVIFEYPNVSNADELLKIKNKKEIKNFLVENNNTFNLFHLLEKEKSDWHLFHEITENERKMVFPAKNQKNCTTNPLENYLAIESIAKIASNHLTIDQVFNNSFTTQNYIPNRILIDSFSSINNQFFGINNQNKLVLSTIFKTVNLFKNPRKNSTKLVIRLLGNLINSFTKSTSMLPVGSFLLAIGGMLLNYATKALQRRLRKQLFEKIMRKVGGQENESSENLDERLEDGNKDLFYRFGFEIVMYFFCIILVVVFYTLCDALKELEES